MSKTSELCTCCITLCSTFLWRPLHDYDLEPPNATFYDFFMVNLSSSSSLLKLPNVQSCFPTAGWISSSNFSTWTLSKR